MKGPFERLKYDLRRLWECPACHRKERSPFTQTYNFCTCQAKEGGSAISMRLVEDGVRRVWGEPPKQREPIAMEAAAEPAAIAVAEENLEPVPFPNPAPDPEPSPAPEPNDE